MISTSSVAAWPETPNVSETRIDQIAERARLDERRRIARDLHDDVVPQLAFLMIDLDLLREQATDSLPDLMRERLSVVQARVKAIGSTVRNVAHELKDVDPAGLGLAVRRLCDELVTLHHIDLVLTCDGLPRSTPGGLALVLFRIVQEALQNVSKHSAARRVAVEIVSRSDAVVLRIIDNGRDFDVEASTTKGIGLANMRERLEPFDGRLSISSVLRHGTRIEVSVPINGAIVAAA
jgi:signal transduction histidine kinase